MPDTDISNAELSAKIDKLIASHEQMLIMIGQFLKMIEGLKSHPMFAAFLPPKK